MTKCAVSIPMNFFHEFPFSTCADLYADLLAFIQGPSGRADEINPLPGLSVSSMRNAGLPKGDDPAVLIPAWLRRFNAFQPMLP